MLCESCGVDHLIKYGSGRFCSVICARSFSTRSKRAEINEKVSIKLQKPKIEKPCPRCNILHFRRSKYCSVKCGKIRTDETKKLLSENAKQLHKDGKIKAWQSRLKTKPSYPEQYFIDLFENEKIVVEREVKIGKWFIDFVVGKVAIEIDGKQHDYPDRLKSDQEKDSYVESVGYKVIRIRWHNPMTSSGILK